MNTELTVVRPWPWGLALIRDDASTDEMPRDLDGPVWAGSSSMVLAVRHEAEGIATVRISVAPGVPSIVASHFDGRVTFASGVVIVSDASGDEPNRFALYPGTYRVVVRLNDEIDASLIDVWLAPQHQ